MKPIYLPPKLSNAIDPQELNQKLRSGEVRLVWKLVQEAPTEILDTLLAGLDLAQHSAALGIDTLPGHIAVAVMMTLAKPRPPAAVITKPVVVPKPTPVKVNQPEPSPVEEVATLKKILPDPEKPKATLLKSAVPSPSALRDELERMVLLDLLGPAGGAEEELDEPSVRDRYLVGMLAPRQQQVEPEEQDDLALPGSGGEDGIPDKAATQNPTLFPSSLGLSFSVDGAATRLKITANWGHYLRQESDTLLTTANKPKLIWKRQPVSGELILPLKPGPIKAWSPAPDEQPEVVVKGQIRQAEQCWVVTLFLVNGQEEPKRRRDEAWLFQPELVVETPNGAVFWQRSIAQLAAKTNTTPKEPEERAIEMLYRKQVGFAAGHGISVEAKTLPNDTTRATLLLTKVVPAYEVPRTDAPNPDEIQGLAGLVLDMKELAETPARELASRLNPLVEAYGTWIKGQTARIKATGSDLTAYQDVALQAMKDCTHTLKRIQAGITLVATNAKAAQAFAFMNKAMWQQRLHSRWAEKVRQGQDQKATLETLDIAAERSWRPFQLAFILLNLPSLVDLHHSDRAKAPEAVADLLWFPTGGGKTEAYLGLTAFTLAIRRLQGEIEGRSGEDGVAVIMRYTLRLLTLQQFQRAAALICGCEVIRREDPDKWGNTPFRLGLWVGNRTTPGTIEKAAEAVKQTKNGGWEAKGSAVGGEGSPKQLNNCPWCGAKIEIKVDEVQGHTLISCGGYCEFNLNNSPSEGLPVLVVDEEIYYRLPSLLIATVDKFAQLPWNGATQMLFGQVDKKCPRHGFLSPDLNHSDRHPAKNGWPAVKSVTHLSLRPPDLIIQDELHLISGPLGSLVGLYETMVDRLCTWEVNGKEVRPKVIAATATIRRASQQVQALFLRQVNIFPPQGLDIEDNFFSRQRVPDETNPGRRYIGICASGRRLKAALIRVYVAHLSAAQRLYELYGSAADPWMTLVGYFNSINELGGMRRLVEDEVRSRLLKMEDRNLAKRRSVTLKELTSRISSLEIPQILDRLEKGFGPHATGINEPLDVLLATNMISVGVDVKRLGLMVVAGQPKTTAEYIQATSRVGRTHPGLVCVVYNWARPRDLSHYEQFGQYHATFYQHVEALSVTPFAPRAIDRGLAALLVSYVRLLNTEFAENSRAGAVTANHPYFKSAIEELTARAAQVKDQEASAMVKEQLEGLIAEWVYQAKSNKGLGYKMVKDSKTLGLLKMPGKVPWGPLTFTCLNSLRDVETSINLVLDNRPMGEKPPVLAAEIVPANVESPNEGEEEN
ncbi:MAG: helicase [Chloroflexi bacterium]|nr:helicase [Chloroflexota bacterium]